MLRIPITSDQIVANTHHVRFDKRCVICININVIVFLDANAKHCYYRHRIKYGAVAKWQTQRT